MEPSRTWTTQRERLLPPHAFPCPSLSLEWAGLTLVPWMSWTLMTASEFTLLSLFLSQTTSTMLPPSLLLICLILSLLSFLLNLLLSFCYYLSLSIAPSSLHSIIFTLSHSFSAPSHCPPPPLIVLCPLPLSSAPSHCPPSSLH